LWSQQLWIRYSPLPRNWPGLDQSQLYEGRDLAVTTDFRLVLSEVVSRYLGNKDLETVFPGFEAGTASFLKLLG
jgi:uncharacterized protein (DUF1501 family)